MNAEPANTFERRFPNQLDPLSRATEEAVRFLEERGVDSGGVYLANLAIEELGTNILKYAYDDAAIHEILLRLEVHPGGLLLVLEDDGREFNPLAAPEPEVDLPAEQRVPGGLGIHLVRKLAERLDYQRCGGRNRITVRIRS
jgi:anti-sigma regulatory factor (Ser/Thr protein kinase)